MVSMQGLGYKEILSWLGGEYPYEEAIRILKRDTRHFAKRQLTWLRRDTGIHWYYWKKTRDLAECLAFSTEILRQYGVS